tara:strand:+ start:3130 stop:3852 length:723 start_codon:yes stop_codon:yes gene_type:complete
MARLTRLQIRQGVRRLLRDSSYPKEEINEAINRVIENVNLLPGNYRFKQDFSDITLVTDDYDYTIDTDVVNEILVVHDPAVSPKPSATPAMGIVAKYPSNLVSAVADGKFTTSASAPTTYVRYMNEWWFDPIPDSNANGDTVRIYHMADLPALTHDLDKPPLRFNERYHRTILVYGAAAEISPFAQTDTGLGSRRLHDKYQENMNNMQGQELWDYMTSENLLRDLRWSGAESWGNVDGVR